MSTKAKESRQIEKARNKIKKQLLAADQRTNEETLKAMSQLIKKQLERHRPERINLSKRQFTTFDENKHSARTESKFVSKLLKQLKNEPIKSESALEGRITPITKTES